MHRLRLVLLPVAVLLATVPGVARADGPPPPRVVSVSAPATSPLGADALDSWQVQLATDSGQPLAEVSLTFRLQGAPSGASEVAPLMASWSSGSGPPPTADGTVTVTARSSRHQAAGHFELTTVTARDATGGHGGAGRGGQVPLAQADVDVVNPDGDATPPQAHAVHLLNSSVVAGDPVVMTVDTSDVGTGVSNVSAQYQAPNGESLYLAPVPGTAAAGPLTALLGVHATSGRYELLGVNVGDAAGNSHDYSRGDPDLDLPAGDLWVTGPASDTTPPRLTSISALPHTAPGGLIGAQYTAADELSGVSHVAMFFDDPQGRRGVQMVAKICGDVTTGPAQTSLPLTAPSGRWPLAGVVVSDGVGNQESYSRDGTMRAIPGDGTSQPSGLDLSAGDLIVDPSAPTTHGPDSSACPIASTALGLSHAGAGLAGVVTVLGAPVPDPLVGVYVPNPAGLTLSTLVTGDHAGGFSLPTATTGSVVHFYGGRDGHGGQAPPADAASSTARTANTGPPAAPPRAVPRLAARHLALSGRATGPAGHRRLRLDVTVRGASRGDLVLLQRRLGARWVSLTRGRLDPHLHVTLLVGLPQRGDLRITVPATHRHTATTRAVDHRLRA